MLEQFTFTEQQKKIRNEFRDFTNEHINPYRDEFAKKQRLPDSLMEQLKARRFMGSLIPKSYYGLHLDYISYGLLNEEISFGCSSVRSLLTVHDMVCYAILKFGTEDQRNNWLPQLTKGSSFGAFALSEPSAGSNIQAIESTITHNKTELLLNGRKTWISFGQIANVFLVFAKYDNKPTALLIPRDRKGVSITPIDGMLGTRAAMLAEINFNHVKICESDFLGKTGDGFAFVANSTLTLGRYSVAWGAVGLAHACYQACYQHTKKRKQGDELLFQHQLVRAKLSTMLVNIHASRMLCCKAAAYFSKGAHHATTKVLMAKYFATKSAEEAAENSILLHGALGISEHSKISRWLFDAKVGVITEGNNDLQQSLLSEIISENEGD